MLRHRVFSASIKTITPRRVLSGTSQVTIVIRKRAAIGHSTAPTQEIRHNLQDGRAAAQVVQLRAGDYMVHGIKRFLMSLSIKIAMVSSISKPFKIASRMNIKSWEVDLLSKLPYYLSSNMGRMSFSTISTTSASRTCQGQG